MGCTCYRHPDGYVGSKDAYKREYQRKYRRMVFRNVLEAYGSKCECCSETEELFLTVEHLNNDGAEHRRKFKGDWVTMMLDIRSQGYPDTYTIRCYNCNSGRQRNGGVCPHKQQW
jgi:hypothetical protein